VVSSDTLDAFADPALMNSLSLVVPMWTMGQLSGEQEKGLCDAVFAGVGIAGFHGGMGDAFRTACTFQMMTGGQFVGHPGNNYPEFPVTIKAKSHSIMKGLKDFKLHNTERYYLHVDPSNIVLATLHFEELGLDMPAAWTRMWGRGKVFHASWGHTEKDFEVKEALEIVKRGMVWAAR
jgi:uncharacterized protein